MIEYKNKYIVYDKNGKVIIISREKEIAISYAKKEVGN